MHTISRIQIENYRSIRAADFPLSVYTPLVGYNNAGKTNIIQALCWAVKKHSLSNGDFYDVALPVVVTVDIDGINADVLDALDGVHRQRIEPLVVDGRLRIRRSQAVPGLAVSKLRFEIQKTANEVTEWVLNPAGIDAAIAALFPDPIVIGAMENVAEDAGKNAAGTTIGKLLKEVTQPIGERHGDAIADALNQISAKLSADGDDRDVDLVGLDEKIKNDLDEFFPGITAKLHIPTPKFGDFLRGATVKIFEHEYEGGRDISSLGHGAQRMVQIALVKCLSEVKANAGDARRTTLLLVDEPELYLHPQAIELVRVSLAKLGSRGYQIVFSTHSANMISQADVVNALLVRRSEDRGTYALPRVGDAVKAAIEEAPHQTQTLFDLSNSSRVLFSQKVLVAEGKTERLLLPRVFEQVSGKTFEEDRIGLVSLGGVGNVPRALAVLNSMGIPTKAVVDLDFAFRGAIECGYLNADNECILECKKIFQKMAEEETVCLDDAGLPRSNAGVPAIRGYELLADDQGATPYIDALHAVLRERSVWLWKRGAIEAHLGVAKTSASYAQFLSRLAEEQYRNGLPDYAGVADMIAWVREV